MKFQKNIPAPWSGEYKEVPEHLDYPEGSIYDYFEAAAGKYPGYTALEFEGKKTTYAELKNQIIEMGAALCAAGIARGDRVLIALPNLPQAVVVFYALGYIGAIPAMAHPLSSAAEIEDFVGAVRASFAATLSDMTHKFKNALPPERVLPIDVADALPPLKALAYRVSAKPAPEPTALEWKSFIKAGKGRGGDFRASQSRDDVALILFSGGTSGKPKAIQLTNQNVNALAAQTMAMGHCISAGDAQVAILPVFHGFGLGVCVHTSLVNGIGCLLIPRFSAEKMIKLLKKKKFKLIAGVPALFKKIMQHPGAKKLDLSHLTGVFCGGDTLTASSKRQIDDFLMSHNAKVGVREGYGLTECVTVCCLNPYHTSREGSIGIPSPDNYMKIVEPGGDRALGVGKDGEICFTGPTLMKGYLDNPEETARALRLHGDGEVWLHTGDIGSMDADGYFYFKQRQKRVIVNSGYNVYPSQVEAVVQELCDIVENCCVVGRSDPIKGEVPVIIAVLNRSADADAARQRILAHCKEKLSIFAAPREVIFITELPKTNVGKIDFNKLNSLL